MLKKTLVSSAIISALLFSLSTAQAAEKVQSKMMESGSSQMDATKAPMMDNDKMESAATMPNTDTLASGEIIGDFNSPDGSVVGATLPGNEVKFSLPMNRKAGEYLHLAVMHAESGEAGWYFAPTSKTGINLSALKFKNNQPLDITQQMGLFQASNPEQSVKVTADNGKLKYGTSNKFLHVTVTPNPKEGKYWITIKNVSEGDYKTPISSGVWTVNNKAEKSFDHTPSAALSALATSGHRDALFNMVKSM